MNGSHLERYIFDSVTEDIEMSPCFSSLSNILTSSFALLKLDFDYCSPVSKAQT